MRGGGVLVGTCQIRVIITLPARNGHRNLATGLRSAEGGLRVGLDQTYLPPDTGRPSMNNIHFHVMHVQVQHPNFIRDNVLEAATKVDARDHASTVFRGAPPCAQTSPWAIPPHSADSRSVLQLAVTSKDPP